MWTWIRIIGRTGASIGAKFYVKQKIKEKYNDMKEDFNCRFKQDIQKDHSVSSYSSLNELQKPNLEALKGRTMPNLDIIESVTKKFEAVKANIFGNRRVDTQNSQVLFTEQDVQNILSPLVVSNTESELIPELVKVKKHQLVPAFFEKAFLTIIKKYLVDEKVLNVNNNEVEKFQMEYDKSKLELQKDIKPEKSMAEMQIPETEDDRRVKEVKITSPLDDQASEPNSDFYLTTLIDGLKKFKECCASVLLGEKISIASIDPMSEERRSSEVAQNYAVDKSSSSSSSGINPVISGALKFMPENKETSNDDKNTTRDIFHANGPQMIGLISVSEKTGEEVGKKIDKSSEDK